MPRWYSTTIQSERTLHGSPCARVRPGREEIGAAIFLALPPPEFPGQSCGDSGDLGAAPGASSRTPDPLLSPGCCSRARSPRAYALTPLGSRPPRPWGSV
jgi:hypothetical protein